MVDVIPAEQWEAAGENKVKGLLHFMVEQYCHVEGVIRPNDCSPSVYRDISASLFSPRWERRFSHDAAIFQDDSILPLPWWFHEQMNWCGKIQGRLKLFKVRLTRFLCLTSHAACSVWPRESSPGSHCTYCLVLLLRTHLSALLVSLTEIKVRLQNLREGM